MNENKKMQRITHLENEILKHKKLYYEGEPIISDKDYDSLEDELRALDPNNPVLHLVGTPEGGDVQHDPPILSCQKAKAVEEVSKWAEGRELYMGYKIDGFSLKVVYNEQGTLYQAATRGNGIVGEDVTLSVMKIKNIPKILPISESVEIRGELYMEISEFERINQTLDPDERYMSPRNLAVGTLKQKDLTALDERKLKFKAFDLLKNNDMDRKQSEIITQLQAWNFDTTGIKIITDPTDENIEQEFDYIAKNRLNLDFLIDGVIFKYNLYSDRKQAGKTEHHPKWQIALKFPSEIKETVIQDIIWQVGRTGVITPVADVLPVEIGGATISRATLHNLDFLKTLNIATGDLVEIERSGDVIPKINSLAEKRSNQKIADIPKTCPSCGAETEESSVHLICPNPQCKQKTINRIQHWVKVTGIEHLGEKSTIKLYEAKNMTHPADLYSLKENELKDLLGKNGEKIYAGIQQTKQIPLSTLLAGLGIKNVGPKMAKTLATEFKTLKNLQNASIADLTKLEGISDKMANYIHNDVNDAELYQPFLDQNLDIIQPKEPSTLPKEELPGKGKRIYVTGKIEGLTKKDIKRICTEKGFDWSSSISRNTDMLVIGENAGKAKIKKAENSQVDIVPWEEFFTEYIEE